MGGGTHFQHMILLKITSSQLQSWTLTQKGELEIHRPLGGANKNAELLGLRKATARWQARPFPLSQGPEPPFCVHHF